MRTTASLLVILLFAASAAGADSLDASDQGKGLAIERQADAMQDGYVGETRDMTLVMINAQGAEAVRKMAFEAREEEQRLNKTIVRFTYPPDTKGTALLTHEQGEDDDDQWLYLPAIKRVKRIASSNQSGSFMGSEFAYEDLIMRQLDKYTYRYIGEETVDGQDCVVIERTPKNKNSGYSRIVRWRLKSNLQELKSDYFDRKGELLKQRVLHNHHQVDGFWRVEKITVKNVQTNKVSILSLDEIRVGETLPERRFRAREFGRAL